MKKPTNYLASRTERLANYRLPFQQKLQQLQQLTKTIQQAWQPILPTELLTTLQVNDYEQQNLVVSTHSHTIANHLNYNQQNLLTMLQAHDAYFCGFGQVRFRVILTKALGSEGDTHLQCNQQVTTVKKCELNESTKQNIAQLCELVTVGAPLKAALQKLIKD